MVLVGGAYRESIWSFRHRCRAWPYPLEGSAVAQMSSMSRVSGAWLVSASIVALASLAGNAVGQQTAVKVAAKGVELKPFAQDVPPAAYSIEMVPIPGSDDGSIKPFFIGKTEITWEAMDVYVYRLDEEKGDNPPGVDAVSRPSKPYIPPDRGFGHEGYAAISVSIKNAMGFCEWLSTRTGRHYRLATEAEWEHAARGGGAGDFGVGVDANSIGEYAWIESNSNDMPHEVGKKKPNAWGLYDMLGNAREWVIGKDGKPTSKGGSYKDGPDAIKIGESIVQTPAWNASDPQVPKSKWWLSDAPFAGFRIVCEADPQTGLPAKFVPAPNQDAKVERPGAATPATPSTPASPATPK